VTRCVAEAAQRRNANEARERTSGVALVPRSQEARHALRGADHQHPGTNWSRPVRGVIECPGRTLCCVGFILVMRLSTGGFCGICIARCLILLFWALMPIPAFGCAYEF